jgi:hypothetical protein
VTFAPGAPAIITVTAGANEQSATAGTPVTTAPSVRVTDASGNPVSGVSVTFAVTAGGGSIAPTTAITTDGSGIAALTSWTLGTTAGTNTLTATVTGSDPAVTTTITATATAGAATSAQSTLVASPTSDLIADGSTGTTLTFTARDANNNPVPGQSVFFAITSGTGTLSDAPQGGWITDGSGVVTATLTTTTAGALTVTGYLGADAQGTVAGTATVTFAPGAPAIITVTAGANEQSATAGTPVTTAPSVRVTDASGNPVSGVSVTFAVTAGGGSIAPTTAITTDGSGIAALTSWTLGTTAGTNTLTATVTGSDPAVTTTITATATAGAEPDTTPSVPLSVVATAIDDGAQLSWTAPADDGGSPITDYRIEVSSDRGQTWTLIQRPASTDTSVTIAPLASYVSYQFRVAAINIVGQGTWSAPSAPVVPASPEVDDDGAPPAPAPGTVIILVDGEPVEVEQEISEETWTIEIRNEAGTVTTAVGALDRDGNPVPFSQVDARASMVLIRNETVSVSGGGFLPGSWVAVWLFSDPYLVGNVEVNEDGSFAGILPVPADVEVGSHTLQVTGRTADLRRRSMSVGVLVLDRADLAGPSGLEYPSHIGPAPIFGDGGSTRSPLLAEDGGSPPVFRISAPAPVPPGISIDPITGIVSWAESLPAGTYTLTVTAANPGGETSAPLIIEVQPYPVAGLTVDSIAALDFTGEALEPAVTLRNGDQVLVPGTDYTLTYSNNTNAGTATVTITGLGNYTGTRTVSFTIAGDTPSAPRDLTGVPDNASVSLEWSAPEASGTMAITGYQVQFQRQDGPWQVAGSFTEPAATISGLENDRIYRFRVRAVSPLGEGPFSTPELALIPRAPMPEPEGDLPAPDPGEAWEVVDGESRPLILQVVEGPRLRLTNGDFVLEIQGRDAEGNPLPISEANPVIRLKRGGSVRVEGVGFEPGSLAAVWLFSDPTLLGHLLVDDATTFTGDLPLPPGIEIGPHTLQVIGRDLEGVRRSANIGVIVEVEEDVGFPATPGNLSAEAGDASVTLRWDAPASSGGNPILGYLIEMQVNGGAWVILGPFTESPAVIPDLANGVPHQFRVAAVNSRGVGPFSSPPITITPEGPLTAPTGRLPEVEPGDAVEVTESDVHPLPVAVEDGVRVRTGDGDPVIRFGSTDAAGGPIPIEGTAPVLRLTSGGTLETSGTGFAPGTQITLWIYPGPGLTALGSVTVDASGQFAATFAIPEGLAPGSYSLQVSGIDAEGRRRATVLGLIVEGDEDLRVSVSASSALPRIGEVVTLTVEVTNASSLAARDVDVDPALDLRRLEILSTSASQGTVNTDVSLWSIGRLEAGQTVTLTIRARVIQPEAEEAR